MRAPQLVHLVFHPASAAARALALDLHRAINDDPALPGLRVPTVLVPEDGTLLPPAAYGLDEAERAVVVVLADDEMVVEPTDLPAGRHTWAQFVGDLWQACQAPNRRFIPVQLSENAWPLDPRLQGTSFVRAFGRPEAERTAWTARVLVVEIFRFLDDQGRGERLPLRLFLSHAKQDVATAPLVFNAIVEHLGVTQPVKTWIDSAEIEGGSKFSEEIEAGVRDSVLLVLATKNYSSRPWCRRELLLAKRHQRPFVIIEALEGLDLRSFPYGGNAPRLRWDEGGAARAVDLVLKEALRHLHGRLVLEGQKRAGDVVLAAAPELATVVRVPRDTTVLYPDPPIGDEEKEELSPLGLRLETPLQRAAEGRPLARMPIALSISESGDCERQGLTARHLDAALHEISRQLLVRGASLHYGGHLGADGYTIALFDMAKAYGELSGVPPAERIVNDVGWPLPLQTLPAAERAKHQGAATFRRIPRPPGVEALDPETFVEEPKSFRADTPERRYAWARGMTAMREAQITSAKARIVLGGKVGPTVTVAPDGKREERWSVGRIPGVIEEAWLSLQAKQPLYVVGAFGGAALVVIDLLEGRARREFTWEFQRAAPHAEAMRALYAKHGPRWIDYPEMTERFRSIGVAGLAAANALSVEENRELFTSRDLTRVVALLLEGLTRLIPTKEP